MTEERAQPMHSEAVSVLMPVRDGQATLGDSIGDLVAGMQVQDELLIVDDGSQDATPSLAADWARRDSRVRILTTTGVGLVEALNLGIREASNDWIARADADDRYPRDRLTFQRELVRTGVALVTGDYRLRPPERGSTYLPCALGDPFVALGLINPQRIPHPGVLFRRDAVLEAGGYREEDFPAEDLGLWIRLSQVGQFVGVPSCVVNWSLTPGSVTHTRQAEQRRRTSELLSTYRPSVLGDVNEMSIREELARYASSSHAAERTLLLLRDLRAWQQRGEKIPGFSAVVRDLARRPVSSLSAAWRLGRDVRSRRRWRVEHTNPSL